MVARVAADLFNGGDLATALLLFAPGYAEHEQRFAEVVRSAFPDLTLEVQLQVSEGDLVATRWRATGTHQGAFLGLPATGRRAEWTGIWLHRVQDGRIAEGQNWGSWDRAGLLDQLQLGAGR